MAKQGRNLIRGVLIVVLVSAVALVLRGRLTGDEEATPSNTGIEFTDEQEATMAAYQRLCEGKRLAGDDRYAEALKIFDELVKSQAGTRYGWDADIQAAAALGHLGRYEDALARFDRILAECPLEDELPKARLDKADILAMAGRVDQAVEELEAVIAEHTDSNPLHCETALETMARAYHRTEQLALLRASLERVSADYPGAENLKRVWADEQLIKVRNRLVGVQQSRVDALLSRGEARLIETVAAGQSTWRAEGGPILITKPVEIPAGATVTVEAGTEIRFGAEGGLIVKGSLVCKGTENAAVRFLPLSDDPTRDYWMGIRFESDAAAPDSRLEHCLILGADCGLELSNGKVRCDNCMFDRCGRDTIRTNRGTFLTLSRCRILDGYRVGILCLPAARLDMSECEVANLTTHGISLREVSDDCVIRDTRIINCGWDGILIRGRCAPTIRNCRIQDHGRTGITSLDGASPRVLDSTIQNNASTGVLLDQKWDSSLEDNVISGNGMGGVCASVRCGGQLKNNRIEFNQFAGILLSLDCSTAVIGNLVRSNDGPGLWLENSQPSSIEQNAFVGNRPAALRHEGPAAIHAAHNYWGSVTETKISQQIEDQHADAESGRVEFRPWLEQLPTHLSGGNVDTASPS